MKEDSGHRAPAAKCFSVSRESGPGSGKSYSWFSKTSSDSCVYVSITCSNVNFKLRPNSPPIIKSGLKLNLKVTKEVNQHSISRKEDQKYNRNYKDNIICICDIHRILPYVPWP